MIKLSRLGDHRYQVHVPKRLETLAFFNQTLLNAFPMVTRLELEKARATTWNDQLKKQLKAPAQSLAPVREQTPPSEPDSPRRRGPRL